MRIQFLGAAGEVTGSCFLVETDDVRFLVDCGMFQGGREAVAKNLRALPFDARRIDFVLLTHAHIDHSGLLPRLVMLGFKGRVHATQATIDLLGVLLLDAAHIQEKESEWQLRHRRRRNPRAVGAAGPLYTVVQAQASLRHLSAVDYDTPFSPHPAVRCLYRDAGHILGSAILEVDVGHRRLVFSGDLGQPGRPVLRDPVHVASADVLLVESTYGNRRHRSLAETEAEIADAFRRTLVEGRGNIVIPAFAVGRTQELLCVLAGLARQGRLGLPPSTPLRIYVDSPMAQAATRITFNHPALLDAETRDLFAWQAAHRDCVDIHFVADVQESMALNEIRSGAVIISASGMCEAGRIKYHLQNNLPRPECTILITGFQAAGTLGRRLVDGARLVRLFGNPVPVRARIVTVGGLSAHADQAALLDWLGGFHRPPGAVYVVHGEPEAAQALAGEIRARLAWTHVVVPAAQEVACP